MGSEKSLFSLGFSCGGLSRASQKLCQFLGLSSKDRASAISCSARTQALSKIKFVMFTPRCSAPRRMSLASRSLARTLNLCERFFRAAVAGMVAPLRTYTRLLMYVQCTPLLRARQTLFCHLFFSCLLVRGLSVLVAQPAPHRNFSSR